VSLRLTFTGSLGYKLAARLELPENPKAYVLFAHYFTGNKDITALSRIARSLYEAGIALFRFDYTQVGTRKKGKAYDHAGYRGINTSRRALQLN